MKYLLIILSLFCIAYPRNCDDGYIEINDLCFFEDDINVIQKFIPFGHFEEFLIFRNNYRNRQSFVILGKFL